MPSCASLPRRNRQLKSSDDPSRLQLPSARRTALRCVGAELTRRLLSRVDSELSVEVRDFISRYIVSIEELEILLMLQDEKARDWSPAEINAQLRSQEASILKWLNSLVRLRLIRESGGRYRFEPESETLARQTAAVAQAYRDLRIKVIEFIFSKPDDDLLSFIRAFDLRKRP